MCGRYADIRRDDEIARALRIDRVVGAQLLPSWNVAPTDSRRIVLERPDREDPDGDPLRQLRTARWGLVPSWAKDLSIGSRMINARSETITEKPAFKAAASRRRCLVPADGYYEWQVVGGSKAKTPFYLHAPDESPLVFAGLYELRPDPALPEDDPDRWQWTYTIITRSATDALGHIHDRTPVIVPGDMHDDWLSIGTTDAAHVREMLVEIPDPVLVPREVGRAVGNVRNDSPSLIEPVGT